ncbi:cytochrome P450 [Stackebrandtia nassauensis]|uniref:Cytochrome P450 n=1 Tax=Stackebrandtia nassauensis (strain DSM 44728 / CIP 108903 / NRRL B-16338 / NBRC 102104 / LLR-40K-21) TaxID=446470 RepID=D3PYH2_STANL|nr:cytochrome P450 [Stackebrandtia nassauensis]ADD41539.1 cytochrome P450 [Stackebrandtia nassauensis DSM 44728]
MTDTASTPRNAFPMARSCPYDPPDGYAALRAAPTISQVTLPSGRSAWLVASHADARALLADPRLSISRENPGFPSIVEMREAPDLKVTPSLIGLDPPEHTALRRPVITEFTVKRIRGMGPGIQRIVDEHIDAMLAAEKPVDLVASLAMPVPSLVICDLLGVPYSDHGFFQERSGAMLNLTLRPEQRHAALSDLSNYMDKLVTRAEAAPGDDLIGRLIVKTRETGEYDHDQTRDLARLLLLAGHETTANMISLGTVALLNNPEQLDELKADSSLWPNAVEELLRYFTIADFVPARTALADIEVGGVTIREGEGVILLTASADRDEAAFEDPDALDIHRAARHHLAFGYGVHQCLGQNLARLELEIVYRTLFDRIPDLRVAVPEEELPFKHDSFIYGMHALPVTW